MKKLALISFVGLLSGCSNDALSHVISYDCEDEQWGTTSNNIQVELDSVVRHVGDTCKSNLELEDELTIKIKDNTIVIIHSKNGMSDYFENCRIIDSKTWRCLDSKNRSDWNRSVEMMSGKYLEHIESHDKDKFNAYSTYGFSGWKYYAYKLGVSLETLHNM